MQKLATGTSANRGFTLIEIMIVMVIIGITVGFALLSYGDFGASKRILFAADQLVNTVKLAQQQAILTSTTYGLCIDHTSYQILRFNDSSKWQAASNKGLYKINYWPTNTVINLKTYNKPIAGAPAIVINPSGDMTPFSLSLGSGKEIISVIKATHNGNLSNSRAIKNDN